MRIVCENCSQTLDLPDDKIPQRRFSVACPACGHKNVVDPTAAPVPAAEQPGVPEPDLSQPAAPEPADAETLPALRGADRELMESIPSVALVVHLGADRDPRIDGALAALDLREVHHVADLVEACEFAQENDVAVLVVRMAKVPAPPCPPLEPIYKLPFDLRREVFVAVVADNVKTLDGQVAFYLQVNCLIQAAEPSIAGKLRRALLYDLRLYRHWHTED
ncbi:MAG: zinc-ribbon domain-containing protein [Acidobacteriota bacterium]